MLAQTTPRRIASLVVAASLAAAAASSLGGCSSAPAATSKAPTVNLEFEKYTARIEGELSSRS